MSSNRDRKTEESAFRLCHYNGPANMMAASIGKIVKIDYISSNMTEFGQNQSSGC
jgi:hypothetical protein